MPKVDVEGQSSKKKKNGKERKRNKKKKKNILNHEHVFGICNKTSRVFKNV